VAANLAARLVKLTLSLEQLIPNHWPLRASGPPRSHLQVPPNACQPGIDAHKSLQGIQHVGQCVVETTQRIGVVRPAQGNIMVAMVCQWYMWHQRMHAPCARHDSHVTPDPLRISLTQSGWPIPLFLQTHRCTGCARHGVRAVLNAVERFNPPDPLMAGLPAGCSRLHMGPRWLNAFELQPHALHPLLHSVANT